MAKQYDFNWIIDIPDEASEGRYFDRWEEVCTFLFFSLSFKFFFMNLVCFFCNFFILV